MDSNIKLDIPLGIDNMSETVFPSILKYIEDLKEEIAMHSNANSEIESEILLLTLRSLNHAIKEVVICK